MFMNWALLVLTLAAHISLNMVGGQMAACYFQEVNLLPCLTQPTVNSGDQVCCTALNQALGVGHRCLCSMLDSTNLQLASTNPLSTPPLMLTIPGCFLFPPSLAACQAPLQLQNSTPSANTKPVLTPKAIVNSSDTVSSHPIAISSQPASNSSQPIAESSQPTPSKHFVPILMVESQVASSSGLPRSCGPYTSLLGAAAAIGAWIL